MRAAPSRSAPPSARLLFVLALVGCSYDWGSVQPFYLRDASADGPAAADPRHTILPGTSCNPISTDGCADSNYCLGMIEADGSFSSLTCRGSFGSGSQGSFCDGASNCVPGFLCWTNPDDSAETTCEAPCFDSSDCQSGLCDTTGPYRIPFGRATLYRCL
jgi:hypothetical protein